MDRRFRARTALVILAALLLGGCGFLPKEPEDTPPPLQPPVKSVKEIFAVRRGDIAERVPLRALIAPKNEAVLFFRQGGRLRRRLVDDGAAVRAGDLLAELEVGNLTTQIEQARIGLERAELRLKQAREKAETFKGEIDPYDEQFLNLDIRSARINLEMLEAQLADARLVAPFTGVVSSTVGGVGEQLNAYQQIIVLQDPSSLVIRAEASEAVAARLAVGMRAEIQFTELGDRLVAGHLTGVPSTLETASGGKPRLITVDLDASGADPTGLRLGSVGRVYVLLQEKSGVLLVPNAAIRSYAGRNYVVAVEGESRREIDIEVGIAGESETEVLRGLREGQKVMSR